MGVLYEEGGGGPCYLLEDSSTSGARYHRVATYSVRAWPSGPSGGPQRQRARPKSQSFTWQLASRRTLDGWGEDVGWRVLKWVHTAWGEQGAWAAPSGPGG